MSNVSIIIPARKERYLQQTIDNLFSNAEEKIEIIVVLDGWWPDPILNDNPNLILIHRGEQKGMRNAVNSAASIARGKYLLKCDAHVAFDKGYDVKLSKDCQPNWLIVPMAYRLDEKTWLPQKEHLREFQYIEKDTLKGRDWPEFGERVKDQELCDLMTFQGSCWFMEKEWFEKIGGEDDINYGWTGREAQEICLKTWLNRGRCVLSRKTWYAHYNKPSGEVVVKSSEKAKSVAYAHDYWMNQWKGALSMEALVEKFSPVPGWNGIKVTPAPLLTIPDGKGMSRNDLYKVFNQMGFKVGCEVGVWQGDNAVAMLQSIPNLKLYLVDPYANYPLIRKPRGEDRIAHAKGRAIRHTAQYDRVFIEKMSEDAAKEIPDDSLDFVYIDGEHTYDFVLLDIILWSRKVRRGGVVSGHDYYSDRRHKIGVREAVDDYVKFHGLELHLTEAKCEPIPKHGRNFPSWYWVKP